MVDESTRHKWIKRFLLKFLPSMLSVKCVENSANNYKNKYFLSKKKKTRHMDSLYVSLENVSYNTTWKRSDRTAHSLTLISLLLFNYTLNITKTCIYNIDPLKPHFYIVKLRFTGVYIIFLISAQKHRMWVLVRTASPRRF